MGVTSNEMKILCNKMRIDILEMMEKVGSGHVGGSLSIVEALVVIYTRFMKQFPNDPKCKDRDIFVLSKGHAGPALYALLANLGYFGKDQLFTLNEPNTNLPSHPDKLKTIGVDVTTGSLGQGISVAAGIALSMKIKDEDRFVYTIVGDGELNEGQCWEAFQFISHYKLNNHITFIDYNKKQLDGFVSNVMDPFDLKEKFKAFGFHTIVVKGDDLEAIDNAIAQAHSMKTKPTVVVLDTIKGQGVKYFEEMENNHSVKFDNEEVIKQSHSSIKCLRKEIMNYENGR